MATQAQIEKLQEELGEHKIVATINGFDIVRTTVKVRNRKTGTTKSQHRYERRWNLYLNGQQLRQRIGGDRRLADIKKLAQEPNRILFLNRGQEELVKHIENLNN